MKTSPRVAVYARVSTAEQTPENQLIDLRRYARERGWAVQDEYVDCGVSGTKDRRPELDRIMLAARKRQVDCVLVWRFDRFARSVRHLVLTLEELQALGIAFVSYQEAIDTATPMGRAMFTIVGALAELERSVIVERVKAGMSRARSQGRKIGRPSMGTATLAEMQALYKEGLRQHEIAGRLGVSRAFVSRTMNPPSGRRPHKGLLITAS